MAETITAFIGLDAHAESTAIGVAELGRAAPRFVGTVGAKFSELSEALAKLGDPARLLIVYEAGPCGYALARELQRAGYRCEVVAPSKVPRRPEDRVKTDRRDALILAGLARAAELSFVSVPDERDEAMRDLSRARIDAVRARLRARQQLKALLLRRGRRYTGKKLLERRSRADSRHGVFWAPRPGYCLRRVPPRGRGGGRARYTLEGGARAGARALEDARSGTSADDAARGGSTGRDDLDRRARRTQALRASARADGLSGTGSFRAHQRRATPARRDPRVR